ncbi:MAG: SUMF1/EgtB/PvdO family nonheme iron enzyme [Candidatus Promineofilum sp.]|nr:SUMF1/EgtB/PvdO family nonheme iron enzyme [Promineifilum sp.]
MADQAKTDEEIDKLKAAIAAQEALRGILPKEQLEAGLAVLREQMRKLQKGAAVADSAVAQDYAAVAAERAIIAETVVGHAVSGDRNVVASEYHFHAAMSPSALTNKALTRYLNRLYNRCNALPLVAMGGEEIGGQDMLLENVYIDLDTTTRILPPKRRNKEKKERIGLAGMQEGDRPLAALEATTQADRLALLGDPGGGKSSFVKQVAAWLALARLGKRELPKGWAPLLPLLVNLRDLAPRLARLALDKRSDEQQDRALRETVFSLWADELAGMDAAEMIAELPDLLIEGEVLLGFDGLDEVPLAERERVRRAINSILSVYGNLAKVIVTCRARSYTGNSILPGFTTHTLAPFDKHKIGQFVHGWYKTQSRVGQFTSQEIKEKIDDLIRATSAPDLAELAGNPMLLTTMAIVHQQEVGLPRERVRLYSQAVQVLLRRWQKWKGLIVSEELEKVLNDDRKLRGVLERLAYEVHRRQSQGQASDLERKEVLALLETAPYLGRVGLAADFLDYVDQRSGLLVGRGGDDDSQPALYGFPHRTFQEYLAGCYLVAERDAARKLWECAGEGDFWYLAVQLGSEELLYNSTAGRNTYLDLAYDLCPEQAPNGQSEWRALVWSGRMASLLTREQIERDIKPGGGRAYQTRLIGRLPAALSSSLPSSERTEAGRALARLGDPRPEVMEVDAMRFCGIPSGPFWMGTANDVSAQQNELPLHLVDLPYDFWMGRFPVSNAQFHQFVQGEGYSHSDFWSEAIAVGYWRKGSFKGKWDSERRIGPADWGEPFTLANHPVVGVTWYEAVAFTRWLNYRWRTAGVLPTYLHVTLPSEAEWEKAARGGLVIPDAAKPVVAGEWQVAMGTRDNPMPQRIYPWGNEWNSSKANGGEVSIGSTNAVGAFADQDNVYGIGELSGNVFEWSRSQLESYPYRPGEWREEIKSAQPDDLIVLRGGSFRGDYSFLRCAFRGADYPNYRFNHFSFRVAVCPSLLLLASEAPDF